MALDIYTEKLNWFKQNEKPEVILLLADNPDFEKITVAWMNMDVKRASILEELPIESERESWEWLWENAHYSISELKEKLGTSLSESTLANKMKPLIGNRIIYPDGTVNSFVERYLRERVVTFFKAKPKRSNRKRE